MGLGVGTWEDLGGADKFPFAEVAYVAYIMERGKFSNGNRIALLFFNQLKNRWCKLIIFVGYPIKSVPEVCEAMYYSLAVGSCRSSPYNAELDRMSTV